MWSGLVDGLNGATLFHHPDWLDILAATQGLHLAPLGIFSRDAVIGVCPLLIRKYGPVKVAASPFVAEDTPYLGPLAPPGELASVLQALDTWMQSNGVGFLRLLLPPAVTEVPEDPGGFSVMRKHTYLSDLSIGPDRLWRRMRDGCRGAVKKAQRSGIEVSRANTSGEVDAYYDVAETVYRDQGRRHPNSRQWFQRIWERFQPSGHVSLLLAKADEQVVGGVFLGHSRGVVYYLDGASGPTGKGLGAGNLLLWHALRWASESGHREFDFVGADIPRLARFKESFGGVLRPYACLEKSRGWGMKALRDAYPAWKTWAARALRLVHA